MAKKKQQKKKKEGDRARQQEEATISITAPPADKKPLTFDKKLLIITCEAALALFLTLLLTIPEGGLHTIGDWTTFLSYIVGYALLIVATLFAFKHEYLKASRILLVFGMAVSLFLTVHHVQLMADPSASFCAVSQTISCDIVNTSEYSELAGIPIAALGFLMYTLLFFLIWVSDNHPEDHDRLLAYAWIFSLLTVLSALQLAYLSEFVIGAWCPICMLTYMVSITVFVFVTTHFKRGLWACLKEIKKDLTFANKDEHQDVEQ